MAETILKTIFQVRRGTAEQWESSTLVLRAGEPAFAIDTGVFKIGTGDRTWNDLPVSVDPALLATLREQVLGVGDGSEGSGTLLDRLESVEEQLGISGGTEGGETVLDRIEGTETRLGEAEAEIEQAQTDIQSIQAIIAGAGDEEKIDTVADLFKYVDEHGAEFTALVSQVGTIEEKLETVERDAQVNLIEKISVGGTLLDIVEKKVEIGYAKPEKGGVVKSSTGANKVTVDSDGYMSVSRITTTSLVKPFGSTLVFDGGSATEDNYDGASLNEALNGAQEGETISLGLDVNYDATKDEDHLVVNAKDVTLDLGGNAIKANGSNGAVKVEGGKLTLEGNGAVEASLGNDKYSMAVWATSGEVVINDGYYSNATDGSNRGTDLIYASGDAKIYINGGTFEAAKPEWTLNCKNDDYTAGTAKIVVKGGRFYQFDPANNKAEGEGTNFVADGYKSVQDGDYYVVTAL